VQKAVVTRDKDRKIEQAIEGLKPYYYGYLTNLSPGNALVVAEYVLAAQHESNLSDNYRASIIRMLHYLSKFNKNKPFKLMIRNDVLLFLDSFRKTETADPMHQWIGTYNLYAAMLTKFFKWLHYPDIPLQARAKPQVVENIFQLKRKEVSIYKPTDLWSEDDDSLFLKYCESKRIKCYHTVSRDSSCRPHEILKLKIRDLVFKVTSDKKQYCEVLVSGKTGSRSIPLINSIPYVKDYLDHEHPQPNNPNAPFICGSGKSLGRHVRVAQLYKLYAVYKEQYFPKLLDNPNVLPEDKLKIKELLRKPWNPYIRRHTGLTEKSLKIPGLMNQYAGWVEGSKMPQKYLHYFGNESSNGLLEAYGLMPNDKQLSDTLKPKQCPNCSEPNKPDSKFCAKCRMVLTYDAYNETLENQKEKEDKLTAMEERFNSMQSQMQSLITTLGSMDQSTKNTFAKQLFENGVYKNEAPSKKEN
jgi:integrase